MRPRVWTIILRGVVLLGLRPAVATAQSLPNVTLGFTSFLDGGPPAGPGFYFQEYIQYYTADRFQDSSGRKIPLLDDLDVVVSLNQLIYQSDTPLLGGPKWGLDLIAPLVSVNSHPGDNAALTTSSGLGDLLVGPYLQWDPIMGENGPILMHRIEFQVLMPTGAYDSHRLLNAGSNVWSLDPYWAGTVFIMPEWTASWRLHYLWNAKNDDPFIGFNAARTQAGQATHLNFASEYEVLPKRLRVGLNGYYLKEFTNPEINGHGVLDSREQVLGIGPGLLYSFSQDDHLFFNAYFETQAENRPEGSRFNVRWTHHF